MKVDRINAGQIRFMLGKADLEERNLNLHELAYGSEKTKALFDDMINQAKTDFGFNAGGQPLMIEAIPLSEDSLMVTMTLVNGTAERMGLAGVNLPGADEPKDNAAELEALMKELSEKAAAPAPAAGRPLIYVFDRFADLLKASSRISPDCRIKNTLFREDDGTYYLSVEFKKMDNEARSVISSLSEFYSDVLDLPYGELLMKEHCKVVIKARALQKLAIIEKGGEEA